MTTILHPFFGQIDPSAPGFWEGTVTIANRPVAVDLTVDRAKVPSGLLKSALRLLDDLERCDEVARDALLDDLKGGEDAAAANYADHHLLELSDADLYGIFGAIERRSITAKSFVSRMFLFHAAAYPEDEERQVILDYTIGTELTTYLLAVSFDSSGRVTAVDIES